MFYEEKIYRALKGTIAKLETYRGREEGTYDFVTGEPVNLSDGYMVTFHQNEADENGHYKSHFGRYTPEEYDKMAFEFARFPTGNDGLTPLFYVKGNDELISIDLENYLSMVKNMADVLDGLFQMYINREGAN